MQPELIIVFRGDDGKWYWNAKASSGEVTQQSEGYSRKQSAVRSAEREAEGSGRQVVVDPQR